VLGLALINWKIMKNKDLFNQEHLVVQVFPCLIDGMIDGNPIIVQHRKLQEFEIISLDMKRQKGN